MANPQDQEEENTTLISKKLFELNTLLDLLTDKISEMKENYDEKKEKLIVLFDHFDERIKKAKRELKELLMDNKIETLAYRKLLVYYIHINAEMNFIMDIVLFLNKTDKKSKNN